MSAPPFGARVPGNSWRQLDGVHAPQPRSVSVVVVHHEQDRQLARTLAALRRQDYPSDRLEVIVVDDGSRHVPEVPDGICLLRQERCGARRGAARNRGARASRGEILCFLDADTAPESEYIQRLARLPSLAPEAVVVGRRRHARLDTVDPAVDIATAGPAHELPAPAWLRDGYAATRDLWDADSHAFRYVISAVLGCTRWFFDELGGFAEEFVEYGGEDWEWAHRAWLRGAIFAHIPDAVAWHDGLDWAARRVRDRPDALGSRGAGADEPDSLRGATGVARDDQPGATAARRAEKNAEAMRLARLITVDGHRARGLFGRRSPIVVELVSEFPAAVAFICVDSLLEALPRAGVRVSDRLAPLFAGDPRVVAASDGDPELLRWPQLHLAARAPFRVLGSGLAALCDAMTSADTDAEGGLCRAGDRDGVIMTLETARHRARVDHWGLAAGGSGREVHPGWLHRLPPAPDVEAYLGGWSDP